MSAGPPYTHTLAIEDEVTGYLNYPVELTGDVIGQQLGPDDAGRHWQIVGLGPRIDAEPGTRVRVWRRPAPGLTLTEGSA